MVTALDLQLTVMSSNLCNMAIFRFFNMAAAVILILKFHGRTRQDGRTASLSQISTKPLQLRPTYGDFFNFSRGRPPISKIIEISII